MLKISGTDAYTDPEAYDLIVERLFLRETIADDVARLISQEKPQNEGGKLRILDQAAGTGEVSLALARKGYAVVAADISSEALQQLRLKASEEDAVLQTTVTDFNRPLPFPPGSFDVVTTVAGNRYITDLPTFSQEIARVLKDDGVFVWPIFSSDIPLWKRASGLQQPTSSFALAAELKKYGFSVVKRDSVGSLVRNSMKGAPFYSIPAYLVARKQ